MTLTQFEPTPLDVCASLLSFDAIHVELNKAVRTIVREGVGRPYDIAAYFGDCDLVGQIGERIILKWLVGIATSLLALKSKWNQSRHKATPTLISNTAFPNTQIQLCIVHMVRNSVKYVPWKDYKAVTADLKRIYQSKTEDEALLALEQFSDSTSPGADGKRDNLSIYGETNE